MPYANFIPEVWSKKLLGVFDKSVVMAKLANTQFEGEIRNAGDTVYVRTFGNVTISNYTRDMTVSFETLADPLQTMVIDQQKYFAFKIDDLDKAQADIDVVDGYANRAAIAIRDVVDSYLIGLAQSQVATGNTMGTQASPLSMTKDNVYEYITTMSEMLDESNIPAEDRHLVISPKVKSMILKSTEFTRSTTMGDNVIQNGYIGNVAGFSVHVTTNMPAVSNVHTILGFNGDFLSFASQVSQVEQVRPFNQFADAVKGLYLYGGKVFYPSAGSMLKVTLS